MAKYLYEVSFERGRSNPEFSTFLNNVMALNAKAPDYGGISNLCLIGHHLDEATIYSLCVDGLKKSRVNLTVVEITRKTLRSPNGIHRRFTELAESYFLPFDDYPNID